MIIPARLCEIRGKFDRTVGEKIPTDYFVDTKKLHFEFIRRNFSILRFSDDFVLSYEVGFVKPSAAIFRVAVENRLCGGQTFFRDDKEIYVAGAISFVSNVVQFESAA